MSASYSCPLAGRRAPELAAGHHEELFRQESPVTLPAVFAQHQPAIAPTVSAAEWADVCEDYAVGLTHLASVSTQKLHYWKVLPWKLCAMALPSETAGREAASQCVHMYETTHGGQHHALTRKLLDRGNGLREQVEKWIAGTSVMDSALSELRHMLTKLSLIPVVERIIEGRGSQVKHALKHSRAGPVRASLGLRLKEITGLLQSPASFKDFMSCFHSLRNVRSVPERLEVALHPDILQLVAPKRLDVPKLISCLSKVLYRVDLTTKFASHAVAGREHASLRTSAQKHIDGKVGVKPLQPCYQHILFNVIRSMTPCAFQKLYYVAKQNASAILKPSSKF
eukprot:6490959-Amphidinium_carterae.1